MKQPRAWYRIDVKGDLAELWVFDAIGKSFWDDETVTAKKFLDDLKELPEAVKTLRVHVNSPGGDPFDATAIANALRAQSKEKGRTVEMSVEGLAASAATIITSAGDSIKIADNALMMVHNPWGIEIGDSKAMRAMADALDRIRDSIVATYQWVSKLSAEDLHALMDATTWMNAAEAVANGFATEIVAGVEAAAQFRPELLAKLGTVPDRFKARVEQLTARPAIGDPLPAAAAAADVLRECRQGDCLDQAERLIAAQATIGDVRARVAYVREVKALCQTAKLPELAAGYIESTAPVAVVKAHLTHMTAIRDKAEIDAGLRPDPEPAKTPGATLNVLDVYREQPKAKGA